MPAGGNEKNSIHSRKIDLKQQKTLISESEKKGAKRFEKENFRRPQDPTDCHYFATEHFPKEEKIGANRW